MTNPFTTDYYYLPNNWIEHLQQGHIGTIYAWSPTKLIGDLFIFYNKYEQNGYQEIWI